MLDEPAELDGSLCTFGPMPPEAMSTKHPDTRVRRRLPEGAEGAALAAAEEAFPPDNESGVLAFGVGRSVTAGRAASFDTINAYVVQKVEHPQRPVPVLEFLHDGAWIRLRPNVIGCGTAPVAQYGGGPLFTGLHVGATIEVHGAQAPLGGVSALIATAGVFPTHLLTAGHIFPPGGIGLRVWAAAAPAAPKLLVGTLEANLLDAPTPRDVAIVKLTNAGIQLASVSKRGPSPASVEATAPDASFVGAVFRPTAHDWSAPSTITQRSGFVAYVRTADRGLLTVRDPLQSAALITASGDSGSALLTRGAKPTLTGSVIGALGTTTLFAALEPAFDDVARHLGGGSLWVR